MKTWAGFEPRRRAHVTMLTTNDRSRVWYSVHSDGSDDIFFRIRPGEYRLYDAKTDPPPIYLATVDVKSPGAEISGAKQPIALDKSLLGIPDREELDRRRWFLIRLLKAVDESEDYDNGVGSKVGRLRRERKIPRQIASLMFVLLDYRNVVGYDSHELKKNEGIAINAAWHDS